MSLRLAFFGTPEFAVPSLRALVGEGFDVAAVVTQPDKPQGRSRSTTVPPPVKQVALEEDIPVYQPPQPNAPDFIEQFRGLGVDLGVVVAYGHILKPALLAAPRLGMINVHASLLPTLRGAAPIQYALLNGLTETGISIMQMEQGMDTGPVLQQVPTPVAADETGGELTARLAELGALALVECLELISTGAVRPEPQDHERATYAPKITRDVARIDWSSPGETVARLVRALDPKPGAWTTHDGRELKLFGPRSAGGTATENGNAGMVLKVEPALVVASNTQALEFADVQPAGRTRMAASEWARGRGVKVGDQFA